MPSTAYVCYDERKNIQQNTSVHDEASGDIVSVMLDTFGDRQTAYKFAVTAAGVRADCRLLDDARNRDYSWDGVWYADAKASRLGVRGGNGDSLQIDQVQYGDRRVGTGLRPLDSRELEDLYWCTYEQNEGQRVSRFGRLALNGFRPAAKGLNLEVYPVGDHEGHPAGGREHPVKPDAGIDIFYNPSEKLTAQLTVNPDFAQIEADPFSFNISGTKRISRSAGPSSREGNEVFMASGRSRNSGFYRPLELFYSRRIGRLLPDGDRSSTARGHKGLWPARRMGVRRVPCPDRRRGLHRGRGEGDGIPGGVRIGTCEEAVLENSTIGVLFVGKQTAGDTTGCWMSTGPFAPARGNWPTSWHAPSRTVAGDFAGRRDSICSQKTGSTMSGARRIGRDFDVRSGGLRSMAGNHRGRRHFGTRLVSSTMGLFCNMLLYVGPFIYYEDADAYTD